jgi:cytochrome bd-type quinol oxidase subunit 1
MKFINNKNMSFFIIFIVVYIILFIIKVLLLNKKIKNKSLN